MNRHALSILSLLIVACSDPIPLVSAPDAATPDAFTPPPARTHCEIASGAAWVDLGVPLSSQLLLPPSNTAIALHDHAVAVAGWGVVHVMSATNLVTLTSTGLPHERITAMAYFGGTWWAGLGLTSGNVVFRYDGETTGWTAAGSPSATPGGGVLAFLVHGTDLLALTGQQLWRFDSGTTWTPLVTDGSIVLDATVSGDDAFVVTRDDAGQAAILRSSDLGTWSPVSWESDATIPDPADLASGAGTVIATPGLFGTGGYYRFDATASRFVAVPVSDGVVPSWIGDDGTVMAQRATSNGNEIVFADALGGAWHAAPQVFPDMSSGGLSTVWQMASVGSQIFFAQQLPIGGVTPIGVDLPDGGATRVMQSTDHGATFGPLVAVRMPAPILDTSTDGDTYLVRARGDLDDARYVALDSGDTWNDRTSGMPTRAIEGVAGLDGLFVTRPSEYAQVDPQVSRDGGRTWLALGAGYPTYTTNISWAVRRASAFATDANGALYAATVGGMTSLCCDGTETGGFDYRPGAGVWRAESIGWEPLNAGIPIAFGPPPTGGAPFRTDVRSIAETPIGMLATLEGRGVYALRADRWTSIAEGLPVDLVPTLGAIDDTAYAWGAGTLWVRDGDLWVSRDAGTSMTSIAARADLMARASEEGVAVSSDAGAHWTALPGVDAPRAVTLSRTRLFATDAANHVHAIATTCTEAP